jgi:hypothetical protein
MKYLIAITFTLLTRRAGNVPPRWIGVAHQVEGLTRYLKPYFSRMFFAAVERRKAR